MDNYIILNNVKSLAAFQHKQGLIVMSEWKQIECFHLSDNKLRCPAFISHWQSQL